MKNCSDAHRDLPSTNSRCLSRFLCVVVFHHTNRNYLVVECSITVKNFGNTWRISGGNGVTWRDIEKACFRDIVVTSLSSIKVIVANVLIALWHYSIMASYALLLIHIGVFRRYFGVCEVSLRIL